MTPECPCVRDERPLCDEQCWHFGGRRQCACGQPPGPRGMAELASRILDHDAATVTPEERFRELVALGADQRGRDTPGVAVGERPKMVIPALRDVAAAARSLIRLSCDANHDRLRDALAALDTADAESARQRAVALVARGVDCVVCGRRFLPLPGDAGACCSIGCRYSDEPASPSKEETPLPTTGEDGDDEPAR